jgi:hypothetical protein
MTSKKGFQRKGITFGEGQCCEVECQSPVYYFDVFTSERDLEVRGIPVCQ